LCPERSGRIQEDRVTTLFSNSQTLPTTKHSMLPVLVVLFLISYGLMTLLIVDQGDTIQNQRTLIQQLLSDSKELATMKAQAVRAEALSRQAQDKNQAQAQSAQTPSTQAPSTQAPGNRAVPSGKARTDTDKGGKAQRPVPARPPRNASEMVDARRNLLSI
jgi:hypothetical protein